MEQTTAKTAAYVADKSAHSQGSPTRYVGAPPQKPTRLWDWLLLWLCGLVIVPALLFDLHQGQVVDAAEARAIAASIHTWRHLPDQLLTHGTLDLLLPYYNGQILFHQLPGQTWLHLLAFKVGRLWEPHPTVADLVLWARLTSVLLAVLTVMSVYWAGKSISGTATGAWAALVCAASPLLVFHGRLASPTMIHTCFAALGVAAALWAIRPLKPVPSLWRQGLGWTLCGLALAGAMWSVGLSAVGTIGLPVLVLLLLCPSRLSHLLGWIAAMMIGVLAILPWVLIAQEHRFWWSGWLMIGSTSSAGPWWSVWPAQAGLRLGLAMAVMLPWTIWWLGALVQPFSHSSKGLRVRLFQGWSWFATVGLVVLLRPGRDAMDDLLPLIPAASVMVAQVFKQYNDLAAEGRYARFWHRLRWPHLTLILASSLAVPVVLMAQPLLKEPFTAALPWPSALGLAVVLLTLAFLSLRWMLQDYPGKALLGWAAWMIALLTVLVFPLSRGPWAVNPLKAPARLLSQAIEPHLPLYVLVQSQATDDALPLSSEAIDPAFVLYADRAIPPISPAMVPQLMAKDGVIYLLASHPPPADLVVSQLIPLQLHPLELSLYRCTLVDVPPAATYPAHGQATSTPASSPMPPDLQTP